MAHVHENKMSAWILDWIRQRCRKSRLPSGIAFIQVDCVRMMYLSPLRHRSKMFEADIFSLVLPFRLGLRHLMFDVGSAPQNNRCLAYPFQRRIV